MRYPRNLKLGEKHVVCEFFSDFGYPPGWYRLYLGAFKLNSFPADGEMLTRRHFTGFLFQIRIFLPIKIERL